MNIFGRLFRIEILGESHGSCIGAVVDGCPAGVDLAPEDFSADLERRMGGGMRGATPRKEKDRVLLKSGIFNGKTTGAPLFILFANEDVRSTDYDALKDAPRPGHADFVAWKKYGGYNDYRGGGHFSGRLTAALVAAGVLAKKLMPGVRIAAEVKEAGGAADIAAAVDAAVQAGDSIGGVVECRIGGLPPGLGEPFFDSVESMIGHAVFSIPAVKGVEFGAGFGAARMRGSQCNDDILDIQGTTGSNNAGGINGGISNGNEVFFRVAFKPTSSIKRAGKTIDLKSGAAREISVQGRHDACIALRAPVVVEAAAAIVLADFMLLEQKVTRVAR